MYNKHHFLLVVKCLHLVLKDIEYEKCIVSNKYKLLKYL